MKKYGILISFFIALYCLAPVKNDYCIDDFRTDKIKVEIRGTVENPGIYYLDCYSTVNDLLDKAVLLENSDTSTLNGNIVLKNNDVLIINEKSESEKISINTAGLQQLISLPNIGEKTAGNIIEYRNENGLFQKLEDLKKVKGIGDKKFEAIKDLICL
ncbi:MAG: ComEA family DNA-binding protein [Erysipelotrichaceae bacterium]